MAWSILQLFRGKQKRVEHTSDRPTPAPQEGDQARPNMPGPESAQRLKAWLQSVERVESAPEEAPEAGLPPVSAAETTVAEEVPASPAESPAITAVHTAADLSGPVPADPPVPEPLAMRQESVKASEPEDLEARWAARRPLPRRSGFWVDPAASSPAYQWSAGALSPAIEGTHGEEHPLSAVSAAPESDVYEAVPAHAETVLGPEFCVEPSPEANQVHIVEEAEETGPERAPDTFAVNDEVDATAGHTASRVEEPTGSVPPEGSVSGETQPAAPSTAAFEVAALGDQTAPEAFPFAGTGPTVEHESHEPAVGAVDPESHQTPESVVGEGWSEEAAQLAYGGPDRDSVAPHHGASRVSGVDTAEIEAAPGESMPPPAPGHASPGPPTSQQLDSAPEPGPSPRQTVQQDWAVARSQPAPAVRFSMLHAVAQRWERPQPRPLTTKRIFVVAGTEAEARRLSPIIRTLRSRCTASGHPDDVCVCAAGENPVSVRDLLESFGIAVDCNLSVIAPGQSLDTQRARTLNSFESMFSQIKPQWLVIAGDTLLTAMASLAAYYRQIHVARIDAGARAETDELHPEEINRQIVDLFSSVHFTETDWSKETLVHMGVPESTILVVGNPSVDALHEHCSRLGLVLGSFAPRSAGVVRVFVTVGHRVVAESDVREIARAVGNLAVLVPGLYEFFWPLPPDPDAAEAVQKLLGRVPGIQLTPAATYDQYLRYLAECDLVLTDSVELQEEAPSLGKPVLMMGPVSRRVEAVRAGVVIPVGNDSASIQAAIRVLARKLSTRHGQITNPYGDGKASLRIADFFDGVQVLEFGHIALPRLVSQPDLPRLPEPSTRWRIE